MKQDVKISDEIPDDLQVIGWYSVRHRKKEINDIVKKFQDWHKTNPGSWNPEGQQPKKLQTVGAACECAFSEISGLPWKPFIEGVYSDNCQDFLIPEPYNIKIDIKGHSGGQDLILRNSQIAHMKGQQICLVSAVFYPEAWWVLFTGYTWSSKIRKIGRPGHKAVCPDEGCWQISCNNLEPMGRLLNIIKSTQRQEEIAVQGELL